MPDLTAKRTLVKSPPELWEELSEVDRLAKHLSAFGEITITKLEPEHTVAWEGERASGTVSIEPSGWGTKVTLHAELPEPEQPDPEPEPEPEPEQAPAEPATEAQHVAGPSVPLCVELPAEAPIEEPEVGSQESAVEPEAELEAEPEVEPTRRRGFWGWLFRERTDSPARAVMAAEAEPVAAEAEPVAAEAEPVAAEPEPSVPEPSEPKPSEPEPSAPEPLESIADEAEPPADEAEPEPEPGPLDAEPAQPDGPVALDPERALVILDEALDTLGAAHHRPFSRG